MALVNKKITELMDELDIDLLKHIELEEEREGKQLDLTRIKEKAMAGISQQQVVSFEKKKEEKKKLKGRKRYFLPLIALIGIMAITVVAVGTNEQLRTLWGESFSLIEKEAQSVQKQFIAEGIIFKVEEAVIDDKSGIIITSFEREDGKTFEKESMPLRIQLHINESGGLGWGSQHYLSEDGKKLFSVIQVSGDKKLSGKDIELIASCLGKWEAGHTTTQLDLNKAYEESKKVVSDDKAWEEYSIDQGLGLTISEEIPQFKLDQVRFIDDVLHIITSYQDSIGEELLQTHVKLIDTRTGAEIEYDSGSGTWDTTNGLHKMSDQFEDITEADLPYLEMGVDYDYFNLISDGKWQVTFRLDSKHNTKRIRPNVIIEKDNLKVKINEIKVSALGVKIEGSKNTELMKDLSGYLLMKDGRKLGLFSNSMSTRFNLWFTQHLNVQQGVIIEEDSKDTTSELGNEVDKVGISNDESILSDHSISFSTMGGTEISLPNLIDVNQVESIVIEDTIIPIR